MQFVVQQGGRIRVVQQRRGARDRLSRHLRGRFCRRRAGAARAGVRARLRDERPLLRQLHQSLAATPSSRASDAIGRPLVADPASRFDLRWGGAGGRAFIAQPFANHNGGHLAFGPDGYLYIGLGDGGSGDDPGIARRIRTELLGKMLRIDVNVPDANASGYRVPADNPFVERPPPAARPEIWAFGLRNPWRYSFDDPARGGTGALVIGDVGQDRWEEIDYEPRGPRRPQLRLAQPRGRARQRHVAAAGVSRRSIDPISRIRPQRRAVDHRRLRLSRRARSARRFAAAISSPTSSQGRVWSLALTIDATGEATRVGPASNTRRELGGACAARQHQLVRRRRRRRAVHRQLFARHHPQDSRASICTADSGRTSYHPVGPRLTVR